MKCKTESRFVGILGEFSKAYIILVLRCYRQSISESTSCNNELDLNFNLSSYFMDEVLRLCGLLPVKKTLAVFFSCIAD